MSLFVKDDPALTCNAASVIKPCHDCCRPQFSISRCCNVSHDSDGEIGVGVRSSGERRSTHPKAHGYLSLSGGSVAAQVVPGV